MPVLRNDRNLDAASKGVAILKTLTADTCLIAKISLPSRAEI